MGHCGPDAKCSLFIICCVILTLYVFTNQSELTLVERDVSFGIDDPNVVDVVVTWVNGSDPVWYDRMIKEANKQNYTISKGYKESRFIQHDEIKWLLRSIERFAPWISMIHIITDEQYPSWANLKNPKIHWVNHSTLYYHGYHTFSSIALQFASMYIPNISRRYIIMDDDYIFLNYVTPSDFFDEDCRAKLYYEKRTEYTPKCTGSNSAAQYFHTRYKSNKKIQEMFNSTRSLYDAHLPMPVDRALLFELETKLQFDLQETIFAKFRQCGCYQVQGLYIGYSYNTNRSILLDDDNKLFAWHPKMVNRLFTGEKLPKIACVNFYHEKYLKEFLPSLLPNKSSFEL